MCDSMSGYELAGTTSESSNETTWHWSKPKKGQESKVTSQRLDKQQLKRQQRQLQNYCAQLIDKFEDDISAALQQGSNAAGETHFSLVCTITSGNLALDHAPALPYHIGGLPKVNFVQAASLCLHASCGGMSCLMLDIEF